MSFTPIENNAYRVQHRRIDAELGDRGETSFKPRFKLKCWGGECELGVTCVTGILTEEEIGTETDIEGNITKVKYKAKTEDDEIEFEYYLVEPHIETIEVDGEVHEFFQNEGGGFEWDIVLRKPPPNPEITFPIQMKNLEFHYQPPLHPDHPTWADIDSDGTPDSFCPENVVGSYAVYHDTRTNMHTSKEDAEKYKVGKVFHIYYPYLVDADGWKVRAENFIIDNGLMVITLPQAFLDTAVYPVVIDPNFGWETKGGSSWSTGNYIHGSWYIGAAGTVTSLTAYIKHRTDIQGIHHIKYGLYRKSDGARIDYTDEFMKSYPEVYEEWKELSAIIGATISAVDYWLVLWFDSAWYTYYDSLTDKGTYVNQTYDGWPAQITFPDKSYKFSIYCTYSTNGEPILKEVSDTITLADSILRDKMLFIDDSTSLVDGIFRNKAFSIIDSMGLSEEVGGNRDLMIITDITNIGDVVLIDKETMVEDTITLIETFIDVGIPKPPSEKGKGVKFWKTKNKLFLSP